MLILILRALFLILATLSVILMTTALIKGKSYNYMIENLDRFDYFMKDWYTVGFFLNSMKLFHLRGKLEASLKTNAKLVYGNIYYEYYANLAWAQFLTFAVLILATGLTICSFIQDTSALLFIFMIVVLVIVATWNICVSKMKDVVKKRREECEDEFPNMVSKLCLLINSGMILHEAWNVVSYGKEGTLYNLMRLACEEMNNGVSDRGAIYKFGVMTDSPDIKKFTGNVIQGIDKGPKELADMLLAQTRELWAHKRQSALQKGEVAAGKLVIPLGITFAGIIMIIVAAAMQTMTF
ncbi:MAG: secretion protein F [Ruminococcus sp.]|nr:secretion protein F [Ruminococcus sp.]